MTYHRINDHPTCIKCLQFKSKVKNGKASIKWDWCVQTCKESKIEHLQNKFVQKT